MTADKIRAEATERLARARYSQAFGNRDWNKESEFVRTVWLGSAAELTDALGDMLPTGAWWAIAWTSKYGERERQTDSIESREDAERFREDYADRFPESATSLRVERCYISDWQEVTE